MKKREFKFGDEMFIKGQVFNIHKHPYQVTVRTKNGHYILVHKVDINYLSDIKPVKKYDVVWEYKYLYKIIEKSEFSE